MERAKIVSQTIAAFKQLRHQSDEIFSEESILSHTEVMIEEFFESKLNPFLRSLQLTIDNIPQNDYTVIALDSWLKALNKQLEITDGTPSETDYPEVIYIRQKYLPKLVDKLTDIKIELLEQLFTPEETLPNDSAEKVIMVDTDTVLTSGSAAFLVAQLYNFKVINPEIPPSTIAKIFGPMVGCEPQSIEMAITYDKTNHRFTANANGDELVMLSKILRSISARVENRLSQEE